MTSGAVMIMAGHGTLALENLLVALNVLAPANGTQPFYVALGFIAVGTGLLKPNVLTMIGRLYVSDDPKREVGYYLYYFGVNLGAFAAPLVCGGLASRHGWAWGFGAAAIGMALGLLSFLIGRRWIVPVDTELADTSVTTVPRIAIFALLAATVAGAAVLVQNSISSLLAPSTDRCSV